MPAFSKPEEIYQYIGGIFETAFADADLAAKLAGTGLVLKMVCTNPESALLIDTQNRRVTGDAFDAPADATMTMDSEVANGYWQGKVNLTFAMARGKVKVDGPVSKLIKLAPLSKKLFPVYVENLRADGREDLIVG
ncbi:SCP2 sterol-binding domain-containing protein [Amycolatopsis carbonis]|uniref:SCP2 sterol-binding domain-containing protein n=1 Tax=Amycolatopsis carbonis TaxID=715471 RepID=A0A9Y2MRA5_9PSEU|nr:SCP2 sterol-binding domain-containing protein [Amycolatopsis sp. 2-15]WIX75236.1 SCP2 sterol-binding domain-containing protein [Amycolatopsis sp. 2-15]